MGHLLPLALLAAVSQAPGPEAVAQLRKAAVPLRSDDPTAPLSDLDPLRKAIGEASIVGAGEATHGSREFFRMKHRLFRFLAERMGFTVFALESNLPKTVSLDRYVLKGEGDLDAALKEQGFWTWETEEVRDLLRWMRGYNANPEHRKKLRVVGVDMQEPFVVWSAIAERARAAGVKDPALDESWYFTNLHGSKFDGDFMAAKVHELIAAALPTIRAKEGEDAARLFAYHETIYRQAFASGRRASARESLIDEHRGTGQRLPELVARAKERLKNRPDDSELVRWGLETLTHWADLSSDFATLEKRGVTAPKVRRAAEAIAGTGESGDLDQALEYLGVLIDYASVPALLPRDLFMADNLEWIGKSYLPGSKIFFWAHNSHTGRSRMEGKPATVGAYLDDRRKGGYYPLGFAFGEGGFRSGATGGIVQAFSVGAPKAGSVDAFLGQAEPPLYFLDLDRSAPALKSWLSAGHPWRNIGSSYSANNPTGYYEDLAPADLFRGLIYVDKVTAARGL